MTMVKPYEPFLPDDNPEWYTPLHIIHLAWQVFDGQPGLDPASCREANRVVQAGNFYDKAMDGLGRCWETPSDRRTVWLNPPYGRGNVVGNWWQKFVDEFDAGHFDAGLFLANAKTETRWFQAALDRCPVLLIRGRLSFWRHDDDTTSNGHYGSALVLLSRPIYDPPLPFMELPAPLYTPDPVLSRFLAYGAALGKIVISVS